MSTNKNGWLSSILGPAARPPPAIRPASGRSVAPPPTARAVTLSEAGAAPPPPLGPVNASATLHFNRDLEFPRIVLAGDATASRSHAWKAAKAVTDRLFTAVPGALEVALAWHGGGHVHTFTPFTQEVGVLRDIAASVSCAAGRTNLLGILDRVFAEERVRAVIHMGDVFEESLAGLKRRAEALRLNDTRVIVLHDNPHGFNDASAFQTVAAMTGGAVLPFSTDAIEELAAMLEAISVLVVGGPELLAEKQATMPAAPLLLERLADSAQLRIAGRTRP